MGWQIFGNFDEDKSKFCTYNRLQYKMRTDWLWSRLYEKDWKVQAATELSM